MLRGMKVLGGVLVFGRIAATYVAANQAFSKVDPFVAHLQTLFTALPTGRYGSDLP